MPIHVLRVMMGLGLGSMILCSLNVAGQPGAQPDPADSKQTFEWPNGKRAAVSLSFDDARPSQIDTGLPLLKEHGVKATFYVVPSNLSKRLEGWKRAVAEGHEIANHSLTHPCTGNYAFSRRNALEDYSLEMMVKELDGANEQIERLLGVKPTGFAYPCGLKFVGRGVDVRSYVPLVAERFQVGRGWRDTHPNDPAFTDLAQVMGTEFDNMDFGAIKEIVDQAARDGRWVVFVGHDIGPKGYQITDAQALGTLCDYLKDPHNGIWLGTVEEVGRYVQQHRPNPPS